MPAYVAQRILIICALDPYEARRILAQLRSQYQTSQIVLLISTPAAVEYADIGSVDRTYNLHYGQRSLIRRVLALLAKLRKEPFDLVIILCRDPSKTSDLRSAILFSLFVRCRRRVLLGPNMVARDLGIRVRVSSLLDNAALMIGAPVAKVLTALVLAVASLYPSQTGISARKKGLRPRVAVLLPVIPDVSHTFIYREVLAMQRQGAEFDTVALEEGNYRIIHPEAAALLTETTFVPKISQARYLALYLYFLVRHPVRLRRLLFWYISRDMGDRFLFLDLNNLHNSLHPCRGLTLAWELKKRGISYVHVYGSSYPATRALVASHLLGIPFSLSTFVDFDYDYDFRMFSEKVQLACFVVACTRFCADRIRSYTSQEMSKKIHTIYFGIDRDYAPAGPGVAQVAKDERTRIIAVGRLVEKKGLGYLVKACALLKARGLHVRCTIIGEGPDLEKIRSTIRTLGMEDEVELLGSVSDDQLRSYMRPQNILVAPSVYAKDGERDGIPNVLLEAMICGLPVISTNVSAIPELIVDGENGLLVPERNEYALADAVQKLLLDADLRERLRTKGREIVLQDFDVENSARRVWSLIKSELEAS